MLSSPALGGAERILRIIAEASTAMGRKVIVVFLCQKNIPKWEDVSDGVECIYLGASNEKLGLFRMLPALFKLSRLYSIQRVYSSHVHLNGLLGVCRLMNVLKCQSLILRESTVIGDRFKGVRRLEFLFFYKLYRRVDLLICQTDYMRERLLEFVPRLVKFEPLVIPNPVNVQKAEKQAAKHDFSVPSYGSYVVTVGRLIETKGGDVLLKAFALVRKEHGDLKLLFVGDGKERESWADLAESLGIRDQVVFLGQEANPFPFIKGAKLGVVSSRREGFPNVLLEMMTVCSNVVSTRCAGGIDKIPGILHCAPGDVEDLAATMLQALSVSDAGKVKAMRAEVQRRTPKAFIGRVEEALEC